MPLSQQELEYLQILKAEVSRRLASSNAVPTQPTVPQVEAAPVAGSQEALNQAVQESASVGQRQQFVYGGTGGYMPPRFTPGSPEAEEYRKTQQKAAATIARVGLPIAATMAAPVGIPAMMAYGAAGGLAGEAGAQAIEKAAGAREEIEPREVAASTIQSAIPVIPGGGIARAIGSTALQAAGGAAAQGIRTGGEEYISGAYIPAAVSGVGQAVGALGRGVQSIGHGAAQRAEAIEKIGPGVQPTLGQAIPQLAALESRIESKIGGAALTERLKQQSGKIADAISGITGMSRESSDVVARRLANELDVDAAQTLANRINAKESAQNVLETVRGTAQEQAAQRAVDDASELLKRDIESGLFSGARPKPFRIIKSGEELEDIASKAKTAFSKKADELYAPTRQYENVAEFEISAPTVSRTTRKPVDSVVDESIRIFDKYPQLVTGQGSPVFNPVLSRLRDIIGSKQPMSLQQLRSIRENLYEYADSVGPFASSAQRDMKMLASRISDTIEDQAPTVFAFASGSSKVGDQIADQLKKANGFYSKYRDRFEDFGVRQAFGAPTAKEGQMAGQMAADVIKEGLDSPRFKNITSLLDDLQKEGAQNVPKSSAIGEMLRSSIVESATEQTGRTIDFQKLAENLQRIETQTPGSLSKLGFGNRSALNKFVEFSKKLGEKPNAEQIAEIIKSDIPAGHIAASYAMRTLPELGDVASTIKLLESKAASSKSAADALLSLRSSMIEDILLETGKLGAKTPRVGAVKDFAQIGLDDRAKSILGPTLFNRIKNDIIPGYKVILESKIEAGQAGATVRGAVQEDVVRGAAGAVSGGGIVQLTGDLINAGLYKLASKVLARSSGATGYRSMEKVGEIADKLSRQFRSGNIMAIEKFSETGEIPE